MISPEKRGDTFTRRKGKQREKGRGDKKAPHHIDVEKMRRDTWIGKKEKQT